MKIHIFNNVFYNSQSFEPVANGMYPIYGHKDIIANIISNNSEWILKLSKGFRTDTIAGDTLKLQQYRVYTIKSQTNNTYYRIIITPKYFSTTQEYTIPNVLRIGSSPTCDIQLPLDFSQNEELVLSLTGTTLVAQTNSSNFFTQKTRISNGQVIKFGDYIFFYGLKIIALNNRIIIASPIELLRINSRHIVKSIPLAPVASKSEVANGISDDTPLYRDEDFFQKSPRLNYIIETADVTVDEPPESIKLQEPPLVNTLGPQITMVITSGLSLTSMILMITGSTSQSSNRMIFSAIAMAISVIGAILWPTIARHIAKKQAIKQEEKRQKKYKEYLNKKQQHLNFICENQKQTLLSNNPSINKCAQIVTQKDISLWERNTSHDDFLEVRIGIGEVPTKTKLQRPEERFTVEENDNLFLLYRQIITDSLTLKEAPVCYDFKKNPISAIAGNEELVKEFLNSIFIQILTFHSYSDLKIVVYTKEPKKWEFLKTAPHCWSNDRTKRYFSSTIENFTNIANNIEKVFEARRENDEEEQKEDDGTEKAIHSTYKDFRPYYLFFIDNIADLRGNSLVNKILTYKRNLGFSILTTANSISMLPSETTSFISISKTKSLVIDGEKTKKELEFTPDLNHNIVDMDIFARQIANIPIQIEKGKFELPKSIPFLELYNCGRVEQLNSLARWKENVPYISLSVPIGIDQNDEIFKMDIHEKTYGPHGLVAGTTGSGKSEWIISYILALAVNFNPDEVQFVLIDYKGGGLAKSFENEELHVKLPHLAGTITNLDKSEIFRSIAAIESELKRRQTLFNDAREKLKRGSMDIYSYQQCYREKLVEEPLSHLLIICDEFAELKQQEPDFMEQLISTSRIGRSLGVHLILATQKPSGVVNEQIWSNSKFKVCLKVQNKSDSQEILKSPDAAFLKQTGSFYLQVGNDDYYNLGQVAWAGAKYYPSDNASKKIDTSVQLINELGQIQNNYDIIEESEKTEAKGEQLLNIVQYLSDISKKIPLKNQQLWLDNVPEKILLAELHKKYNIEPAQKYSFNTIIGEYDEPRRQKQGVMKIDLAGGNIGIIGKADGGIEKLVSTIIWSTICNHNPAEVAFYIIDFGSETMKKFEKFPHVGEVIFREDPDRVAGMINFLRDEIENRRNLLSDYNGSFEYYNKVSQEKLNLIEVIINNYDVVNEVAPKAAQYYTELFRDSSKYGINFIVTANAQNAIGMRIQQYFNHIILMQLADDTAYRTITNCRRGLIPKKATGRGICKLDSTSADSYCEFQTALIDEEEKEIETLKTYAQQCIDYYKCKVKQLTRIPDDITSEDLAHYTTNLNETPIGVSLNGKQLAKYDFLKQKVHIITSKNIAAQTEVIYALTSILSKSANTKVHVVDLLQIFKKPILDIQMFDQDKNIVFGALEKDIRERKESQDYGITIVLGAGQFKQALNEKGQGYFRGIFNNIQNSKKTIYILIDSYESMRTLIMEDWFKNVSKVNGIWLGAGLDSQSLFECDKPTEEDSKYNFPGLAFVIENGKYSASKLALDKDK